jgi:hypothetical protein
VGNCECQGTADFGYKEEHLNIDQD